ncbi:hypothetical protein ABEB36_002360 [Hypothenemus hampei]|uniref:Lipoprotein n=1 Tax=Hypothenemus hampei TaxID=57062 RepID=A0ABD1F8K3_HYPHA
MAIVLSCMGIFSCTEQETPLITMSSKRRVTENSVVKREYGDFCRIKGFEVDSKKFNIMALGDDKKCKSGLTEPPKSDGVEVGFY